MLQYMLKNLSPNIVYLIRHDKRRSEDVCAMHLETRHCPLDICCQFNTYVKRRLVCRTNRIELSRNVIRLSKALQR
jgi:hypothetical protein